MRSDPRGRLIVSLCLVPVLALLLTIFGFSVEGAGRLLGMFYFLPVLIPTTGWVLRRRGRSLKWLLLWPLSIVPFFVAPTDNDAAMSAALVAMFALVLAPVGVALFAKPASQQLVD